MRPSGVGMVCRTPWTDQVQTPVLPPEIELYPTTPEYSSTVREFQWFCRSRSEPISFGALRAFFQDQEHLAPSTYKRKRAALKAALLAWCDGHFQRLQYRPMVDRFFRTEVKYPRILPSIRRSVPKAATLKTMLGSLPPKYAVLLEVLIVAGLRVSECLQLDLAKARKHADHYEFRIIGKRRRERVVQLDQKLVHRIVKICQSTTLLFLNADTGRPYTRQAVSAAFNHASSGTCSAHQVRHFHITRLLEMNFSLEEVSRHVAHSSRKVTADLYDHRTIGFDELPVMAELLSDRPTKPEHAWNKIWKSRASRNLQ